MEREVILPPLFRVAKTLKTIYNIIIKEQIKIRGYFFPPSQKETQKETQKGAKIWSGPKNRSKQ